MFAEKVHSFGVVILMIQIDVFVRIQLLPEGCVHLSLGLSFFFRPTGGARVSRLKVQGRGEKKRVAFFNCREGSQQGDNELFGLAWQDIRGIYQNKRYLVYSSLHKSCYLQEAYNLNTCKFSKSICLAIDTLTSPTGLKSTKTHCSTFTSHSDNRWNNTM